MSHLAPMPSVRRQGALGSTFAWTGGVCSVLSHKAGSADPCGVEGQGGAKAAGTGWQERLAAPSATQWASKLENKHFRVR